MGPYRNNRHSLSDYVYDWSISLQVEGLPSLSTDYVRSVPVNTGMLRLVFYISRTVYFSSILIFFTGPETSGYSASSGTDIVPYSTHNNMSALTTKIGCNPDVHTDNVQKTD